MNVINFPDRHDFENLSLAERMLIIESWIEEMDDNLPRIREAAAAIDKLIEANKKYLT
ncbi:hypothetical protein [Sinorhizobium meliloti]|uniref:hypothetical protein n=1 Tax=Rhizobium meliloti TaxID=382 RepID=UPI0013E2F583|nr:hypothetical protein [Sinorhizobium meliloti]